MADGVRRREEVLPPGVRGEDAITPKPPKYRYSMEEDTELTMEDKEKMNQEEEEYAEYSQTIELSYRVRFEQRTTLRSMYFAHHTPRQIPFGIVSTEATLQIFSFKIVSCELSWPLYVYGLVAVRDQVDDHRNILFERRRRSAQLRQLLPLLLLAHLPPALPLQPHLLPAPLCHLQFMSLVHDKGIYARH
ncbi:hypothetical protein QYE76_038489 [Lolium multiflorum]|uniref:DUF6598 domain-containing protein n=1 Tax=Lolium multiflorum TaxID=4521 RepID=A0AAD8WSX8_LOLMU|nr:hypothetical protein QYE76_038489 [Lolium multiflorum]